MDGQKGYYSLIQYCPDPSRAEAANVGVLLFCPALNYIDAQLARGNDRVTHFFGKDLALDLKRLNTYKLAMKERLSIEKDRFKSLADLEQFIRTRANEIQITEPRSIRVVEPERQLEELFRELVGGREHHVLAETATDFPELNCFFKQTRLHDRVQFDLSVKVPVLDREIKIPYAYTNGVMNLVKPQKLAAGFQGVEKAMALAYEGELIKNETRQLVVVLFGEDTERGHDTESEAVRVLQHKEIKTVTRVQLPDFEKEVVAQAH